jgi:hypothetical protein
VRLASAPAAPSGHGLQVASLDQAQILTHRDHLAVLVFHFDLPDRQPPARLLDVAFPVQPPAAPERVSDPDGVGEAPAHPHQPDRCRPRHVHGAETAGDGGDQAARDDRLAEMAAARVLNVRVQGVVVARHPHEADHVGLGDGAAPGRPLAAEWEIFEMQQFVSVLAAPGDSPGRASLVHKLEFASIREARSM